MRNKNMLKIKKVGEERYFKDETELRKFLLKSENMKNMDEIFCSFLSGDAKSEWYWRIFDYNSKDLLYCNGFLLRVCHGPFIRIVEDITQSYEFNIIAEQHNLTRKITRELMHYDQWVRDNHIIDEPMKKIMINIWGTEKEAFLCSWSQLKRLGFEKRQRSFGSLKDGTPALFFCKDNNRDSIWYVTTEKLDDID